MCLKLFFLNNEYYNLIQIDMVYKIFMFTSYTCFFFVSMMLTLRELFLDRLNLGYLQSGCIHVGSYSYQRIPTSLTYMERNISIISLNYSLVVK